MYETESNVRSETASQIPSEVLGELKKMDRRELSRTVLPWSEHCTECVWPTCYSTCDLYHPREDGRCRRFEEGMVRVHCPEALNSYLLKITFKRWAKLWSPGNIRLYPQAAAQKIERRDQMIGSALFQISLPNQLKSKAKGKRYSWKKRMAQRPARKGELPTSFVIECFNPNAYAVSLSLTMRPTSLEAPICFQRLFAVQPGFQRMRIPVADIAGVVDLHSHFSIDVIPNTDAELTTIYFGLIDFVREPATDTVLPEADKGRKIKCVVWDLDNTLWDGILVEDGASKLRLKSGTQEIVKALDQRGILNSIASKNDHAEVVNVLKNMQMDEYFLCPQVSWLPKSEGIKRIAEELNIGLDTLLFVDDSEFELAEVKSVLPQVRTLTAEQYESILALPECQVPVTPDSSNRRRMYQVESQRQNVALDFGSDYLAFLKHCDIRVNVGPLIAHNIERVHELTQRTNQMNFSGTRYDRSLLTRVMETAGLDTYVIDCQDRFGAYGIVGFAIVNTLECRMTDLMFSCRIQSKRVEHAFLSHVIRKCIARSGQDFYANYRKTSRNAASGKVFADFGMMELETRDGVTSLMFPKARKVPDDGILEVVEQGMSVCEAQR